MIVSIKMLPRCMMLNKLLVHYIIDYMCTLYSDLFKYLRYNEQGSKL